MFKTLKMKFKKRFKKRFKKKLQNKIQNKIHNRDQPRVKYANTTVTPYTIRYTDYNGNDLTHLVKHSYCYKGVPGGFYV